MNHLLECVDVHRTFRPPSGDVPALQGVSLTIDPGELVALMGPSGSGKSTLLAVVAGLEDADRGTVSIDGVPVSGSGDAHRSALRRRSTGLVHQKANLVSVLTAVENVALPLELDGTARRAARAEALAMLEHVGLPDVADRFPEELSGGQQQRVAIARGLVGPRRLLLADEPTGALDTNTGDAIIALLRERCDAGAGCLLVTHETRYAGWADRVVWLRDGTVVDDLVASRT